MAEEPNATQESAPSRCCQWFTKGDMARYGVGCALLCILVVVHGQSVVDLATRRAQIQKPELFLKAPERARKDGYQMETHHVQTEDGYILGLHRIPGKKSSQPVLLQHGQLAMSDGWIAFGHSRSLAYQLADRGYDVWLGNVRGNLYSKKHTSLKPSNPAFWKFSWHEMGTHDLPAMIDYILNTTGHSRIYYVGHSLGGRIAYVLLSMRPEYNEKIRLVVTMASLATIAPDAQETSVRRPSTNENWSLLKGYLKVSGTNEMLPYSEKRIAVLYYLCTFSAVAETMCMNIFMNMFGDSDGTSKDDIPMLSVLSMGGNSASTILHYRQMIESGRFQQFDYGTEGNQEHYNSSTPREYDLKLVNAPVAIHYGETDRIAPEKDMLYMSTVLPNVAEVRKVPAKIFNHMDFISHMKVKELLYDHLITSLENY